jgi:hypothetical protein
MELGEFDGFAKGAELRFLGPKHLEAVVVRGIQIFRIEVDLIVE